MGGCNCPQSLYSMHTKHCLPVMAPNATGTACVSEKHHISRMHSSNQVLSTAMSKVLVHATDLGRMSLQVVELPPVELVSNGTIAAQDIKACDEKVDIWALGVTLFELLTGRLASFLSNVNDARHRTDPVILANVYYA